MILYLRMESFNSVKEAPGGRESHFVVELIVNLEDLNIKEPIWVSLFLVEARKSPVWFIS